MRQDHPKPEIFVKKNLKQQNSPKALAARGLKDILRQFDHEPIIQSVKSLKLIDRRIRIIKQIAKEGNLSATESYKDLLQRIDDINSELKTLSNKTSRIIRLSKEDTENQPNTNNI